MTRAVPQHWLLFAGPSDTGLAVQLEPVMSKNGISLSFTPGPIGERLDIELTTGENHNTPSTGAYRALEDSAQKGGGCGYALLQSEDHLRCEATFRFQFEKQYLKGDVLHNVSGASADLLFGLAVVTAVRNDLEYRPFAATGILSEDGQVQPIEGLRAKIHAALDIPALRGKGLIFYPKANEGDIDAELRHRVEQAQIDLKPVERLEEAVECLGIPIQGTWIGNPYRRLDVFEYGHRRIYFGRENEADHLAKKLFERSKLGRPSLLILGPSGGGKSSLVQAGLIPELEKRFKEHAQSFLFSVFDLRSAANKDVDVIATSIRSSWSLLPGLAALAVNNNSSEQNANITPLNAFSALVSDLKNYLPDQTCFVWVLDQLEQLFTLGLSEEADAAFIHFLQELQASGIWIVATFRNDFYSALRAHDGILSIFDKDGIHDLEKLSETMIERIIQEPAKLAKLEFEKDDQKSELLSLKLKNDALGGGKDILPLLEFALDQLYEKHELKNGRTQLTWAAYEDMGGLQGAVGKRADEILNSLDESAQEALGRVLRAIAKLRRDSVHTEGGKNPFIASIVDVEQFLSGAPARRLVDAFADARLFVRDRDNEGIAQIRVTHEALFTHWPKADEILKDSMKDMVVRERLADSEAHWKAENEAVSLLLQSGLPLEEAQDLLVRLGDELHPDIIHYIEQSVIADQERKQQESKAQRRKTRFAIITAVVLGILLIVAAGAGYFAVQRGNELAVTLASSDFSEGVRLVDQGQSKEALAYLARALRLDLNVDTPAARFAASLLLSPKHLINISIARMPCFNGVSIAQFSSDGRKVLMVCNDTVQVWDTHSRKPLLLSMEHAGIIHSAQFSPDGRWIVTASADKTVRVWEVTTGALISQPMVHEDSVKSVQFSPDGRWVVTASADKTARVWEVIAGALISQPMVHEDFVESVQFSPDGRWVITTSLDKTVRVWEATTGDEVFYPQVPWHLRYSPQDNVQISPDGRGIATVYFDDAVRVWDMVTGAVSEPMEHRAPVRSVKFSPDGRWVVTTSGDKAARVWESATGKLVSEIEYKSIVYSAQFSPDGRWVLTTSLDKTVVVWNAVTGEAVSQPMQHQSFVTSAQFSPDGRWVITASWDQTARIWEVETGEPLSQPMQHGASVQSAQFSSDGRWVVTTSLDKTVWIWEVLMRESMSKHLKQENFVREDQLSRDEHRITADFPRVMSNILRQNLWLEDITPTAQISPDGRWVAATSPDKTVQVWEVTTGAQVSAPMEHETSVHSIQFSPDGRWLLTTCMNKAWIWEAATGAQVSGPMYHEHTVQSAQFSPDGRWVVTASSDRTARIWKAATGEPMPNLMHHEHTVQSARFSPDGRWVVTASSDSTAQVWDATTGIPVSQPMVHKGIVGSALFSPDGHWVVTASLDNTAQVWEAATGIQVSQPMMHKGSVESVQFSPDGRWVATASLDNTAQVWETATGTPVSQPMMHKGSVESIQFSPDGRWVVTASRDQTAQIWEASTGKISSVPFKHQGSVSSAEFSSDGSYIMTVSSNFHIWKITRFLESSKGFAEFLERVSGYVVNSKNALQAKYKDVTLSELRDWVATNSDFTREEREFINWWLSDPIERTVTPSSKQTVKEWVQMLINRDTIVSLNEALDYYPGHPMALARLAAATWRETKTDQQNDIRPRVALWANLALKYAPDDTDVRAVAEKVLQNITKPD